ncbi:MAG: riboflavin synthase [Deltaproteobacteria bacterium]|nr:riboflavin synthase [Deltaproteobacteria bacterium]
MFTGLVEDIGEISNMTRRGSGMVMTLACRLPVAEISLGDSIAVDGVCLTVTGLESAGFAVDVSPESLQRTTMGGKRPGGRVNLERALRLSDRLGGHIVTGHIDGTAVLKTIDRSGDFVRLDFTAPAVLMHYIIDKGSVAIDGISLTVNKSTPQGFEVMIIPHTFAETTLSSRKTGEQVNIENDVVGKYVERFVQRTTTGEGSGVTRELLEKFNFM